MSVFGKRTATLCVLFLLPTFAGSIAGARNPQSSPPAVEALTVDAEESAVEVTLIANEDVRYTYFRLDGPRLVIDVHDAENRLGFAQKAVGEGGVMQVRVAPFSDASRDVTRVVFDLEDGTTARVVKDGPGRIRAVFSPPATDRLAVAESASQPDSTDTEFPASAVTRQSAEVASDSAPAAFEDVALAPVPESAPVQVASLVPTVPGATVSGRRPESGAQAEPTGKDALPDADAVASASSAAGTENESSMTSVDSAAEAVAGRLAELGAFPEPDLDELAGLPGPPALSTQVVSQLPTPEYTGEVYDFDLRDVALQDFFRTVSDLSGLNVILDPSIPNQTLTMTLYQVPWDQALDIVLRNYNLAWELNGNVLRIALQDTLRSEEQRRREYRELQEQNGPLVNNTYILSYAEAGTAATLVSDLLSDRGSVVPVQERNALIVTDIENRVDSIERMIDFLDTPSQQVEIEARLLQANKTFRRELGNQLGLIINNNGSNILTGVPSLPSPFERNPAPTATAGSSNALPLVADFGLAAPTAGLSFLLGVGGDVLLDEVIQVAETRGTARLLSRPNVVVQNNEAAIIEQGTQIPVQTNVNNTITVQFQQFALRLEVTPQITEEGTILLNAIIENSTPDFSQQVDGIPSIATQRAQTRVLIDDGATAMVGGILIDSDTVSVSQVPGLGNIPILGNLFKSTSTIKGTSELLFFVTARIKPADTLDFLTAAGSAGLAAGFSDDLLALDPPPPGIRREGPELAGPDFN